MIFEKPSLRTRVTFDVGMEELGGHSVYLSPAEISLGKRESVYDVAKNLERMVHGIMIRTFAHEIVVEMARCASIPVINGLTDYSHPCQAMADYLTMLEVKGRIAGLKVAYIGDGNNVAHSLMFAGAQLGAHVWIATPPGYEPDANAVAWAAERCARPAPAAPSPTIRRLRPSERTWFTPTFGRAWGRKRRRRRGAEFSDRTRSMPRCSPAPSPMPSSCIVCRRIAAMRSPTEVIDSPRSFVFPQAENRLHAQKAIMLELMGAAAAERERVT